MRRDVGAELGEMTSAILNGAPPEENVRQEYKWNDTGNADRLRDRHGDSLLYCEERRSLMVWDGLRWACDGFVRVERLAEETLLAAFAEAGHIADGGLRKAFTKFLNGSLQRAGIANMVHSVKRKVELISVTQFDAYPFLLNCKNGTIDLRTGQLYPHRRDDRITKIIPIRYDATAECPKFERFIFRIMGDGPNATTEQRERAARLVSYLQRLFGCAATGKAEKILVILHGAGNNGKTTLIEIMRAALGDLEYAGEIQVQTLMASAHEANASNAVNADLADLKGLRLVSSSEPEQGQKLSLSRVKYLTGLGQLRARYLHENFFNFKPTHKLFLDCNHKPVVTNPTDAVWNRLKLIPFDVEIPPGEIDVELINKLRTELPGILRWVVEGAIEYCRHGLGEAPTEVDTATENYRQESDRLKDFIEDRCELGDPKAYVPIAVLYPTYAAWAEATGDKYPLSKVVFDERLQRLGCTKGRDPSGQTRAWKGIRFKVSV